MDASTTANCDERLGPALVPGSIVGRYRLGGVVGRGGMGVVFRAHDPQLRRTVAIKVLAGGPIDARGRARLLREAQALAKLNHGHVVAVYDVGFHGQALYLVEELVEGTTLRTWLGDQPRTQAQILEVFRQAGEGLAAAHDAGLIHRDFKPSNVLIGIDGRARVADFGLVRRDRGAHTPASGQGTTPAFDGRADMLGTSITNERGAVGTPRFMAPEQHRGDEVDARADQYSFCVALVEALVGERMAPGDHHLVRRVAPRVRAVVRRGLRPDPRGRYPHIRALLRALDSGRRGRRFGIALGVASTAGLAVLMANAAPDRCEEETPIAAVYNAARRTDVARAAAQHEQTQRWTRVAAVLDAYAAAWSSAYTAACRASVEAGADADPRAGCLHRCMRELDALLRGLTRGDAPAWKTAASAARRLRPVDSCTSLSTTATGVWPPSDERLVAQLDDARARNALGDFAAAGAIAADVVVAAHEANDPRSATEAGVLVAQVAIQTGDARGAEEAYLQAHRDAVALGERVTQAVVELGLASLYADWVPRHDEAARYLRFAEAAFDYEPGPRFRLNFAHVAAGLAWHRAEYDQALSHYEEAAAIAQEAGDPVAQASTLADAGSVLILMGRQDEARERLHRAIALFEAMGQAESWHVALALNSVGVSHLRELRWDLALPSFERARAYYLAEHSEDVFSRAMVESNVGLALQASDPAAALGYFERARSMLHARVGDEFDLVLDARAGIAMTQEVAGELDAAVATATRVLDARRRSLAAGDEGITHSLLQVGRLYLRVGRVEEAIEHLTQAHALAAAHVPASDPVHWESELRLGEAMLAAGRDGALRHVEAAFARARTADGVPPRACLATGRALRRSGEAKRAIEILEACMSTPFPNDTPTQRGEIRAELDRAR